MRREHTFVAPRDRCIFPKGCNRGAVVCGMCRSHDQARRRAAKKHGLTREQFEQAGVQTPKRQTDVDFLAEYVKERTA